MSSLLCELHAHTTWSDGELSLLELVDLYGSAGFDVLCVTDRVLRLDDPWPVLHGRACVDGESIAPYLEAIAGERDRARSAYGLLVVPGLELTYNDPDADRACHAVAVGLERLVSMDEGPAAAMEEARDAGAAVVVAHPYELDQRTATRHQTRYFARGTGASFTACTTAPSSSTAASSSAEWRNRGCDRSGPATCIARSSSPAGRRWSRASTTRRRSSTTSAPHGPSS